MTSVCDGCDAPIEWATTTDGQPIALNPQKVLVAISVIEDPDLIEMKTAHRLHDPSCPAKQRTHGDPLCGKQCATCGTWINPRQQMAIYVGDKAFCNSECRKEVQ